jgi:branched-chain amino acid transport system substrate-binding protein
MRRGSKSALLWTLVLLGRSIPAAEPRHWKTYTTADGLPDDMVLCVTVDGPRVWAGTRNGLALIEDGRVVRVFRVGDGLPHPVVSAIAMDKERGDLWIATFGGLSRYSGGYFENYSSLSTGLANDVVYDVAVQGRYVWTATAAGISRLDTDTGEWAIFSERNAPLRSSQVVGIAGDTAKMYFALWDGGAVEYDSTMQSWKSLGGGSDIITSIARNTHSGAVWITSPSTIRRFDGRNWRSFAAKSFGAGLINCARPQGKGIWVCSDAGLTYFEPLYHRTRVLNNRVLGVAFQGEDIWAATAGGLSHGTVNGPKRDHAAQRPARHSISRSPSVVNIGFYGPIENSPDSAAGLAMLQGAQLAIEEANARGGYRLGLPYVLKIHNDSAQWGGSTAELVKMAIEEDVIAALGPIDPASAHVLLRTGLTLDLPIVYAGATDPALTEAGSPWVLRLVPDDRRQSRALLNHISRQSKHTRLAVIHSGTRTARAGVRAFLSEARRAGFATILKLEVPSGTAESLRELQRLRQAEPDALAVWATAAEAAPILRQLRAAGLRQPVFGPSLAAGPDLVTAAGSAAEGFVGSCVLDPSRENPEWLEFQRNYRRRFDASPDPYTAHAYDGTKILIEAIEKAGPNRSALMAALRELKGQTHKGVIGELRFDSNLNRIAPLIMSRIEGGRAVYWSFETGTASRPASKRQTIPR